uniref:Uncharacterized protein n=1 Tax=Vespula pensylvanica TaxID=30213 RepID=A0A834PCW1_VESPE|nr:hypothetical protein H0235_003997 [Vespula pensylvanica]
MVSKQCRCRCGVRRKMIELSIRLLFFSEKPSRRSGKLQVSVIAKHVRFLSSSCLCVHCGESLLANGMFAEDVYELACTLDPLYSTNTDTIRGNASRG